VLAGVVAMWAGSFAAIKHLLDGGISGPEIAAARFLMVVPAFAVTLYAAGGLRGLSRGDLTRIVVAGVCWVAIYHLALNEGELHTTAGTAAVVVGTAPGITLALAILLGLERFSPWRAGGLLVAFTGVVIVVILGSGQRVALDDAKGPLLVLVAAIAFALYNVLVKPLADHASPGAISSAASLAGTVPLLFLLSTGTAHDAAALTAEDWVLLVYLGVGCTLLGYIGWTMALRQVDASRAVAYLYAVPPLAVLIGAVTLSEQVTGWLALGGLLVVGGVAITQVQQ
jgi:drug/metabolite transporter (DMT)-like permease